MTKMKLGIVLVALLVTEAGHAQSSITLYGVADDSIGFTSNANGAKQYALVSGAEASNRWGIKGTEDLGGGLSAIFDLESGFSINSGAMSQNGTEFGRQAFVGLTNKSWGTLTFGRQYSVSYINVGEMTGGGTWAASGAGYGAHPGDVDNLDSFNRVNNAIIYQSPDFRGLSFSGLYSPGGVAGAFSQNQIWDFSSAYVSGPVKLAVGYLFVKDPNFSFWGNKANDSHTGTNITSPVLSGYATAGSEQVISAGGTYAVGKAVVGLVYSNTQFQNLGSVGVAGITSASAKYRGTASFNIGEVNARYQFTPAFSFGGAYSYTRSGGANDIGGARYQQVDLSAIYSLSQRTSIYAMVAYQNASGHDSTGDRAVAAIAGATPSRNGNQTVAVVGMTHRF
jgi:predicted porin